MRERLQRAWPAFDLVHRRDDRGIVDSLVGELGAFVDPDVGVELPGCELAQDSEPGIVHVVGSLARDVAERDAAPEKAVPNAVQRALPGQEYFVPTSVARAKPLLRVERDGV